MMMISTAVACTRPELAYLAALAGTGPLMGAADPFFGRLADEVEAALSQAKESLLRRGLIELQPDGTVVAEAGVAAMIAAATQPSISYRITRTLAGVGTSEHYIHVAPGLAVELAAAGAGQYDLLELDGPEAIWQRAWQLFRLDGQAEPQVPGGVVPEALLQRAQELAEDGTSLDAAILLQQGGLPAETAEQLASALAGLTMNGAMIALTRRPAGVGLLEGAGGLWLLRPEAGGGVAITPAGAEGARMELSEIILSGHARSGSK